MKRYTIDFHASIDVEADSRWEAFEKAWRRIDGGEFEFDEPQLTAIEHIPGISRGRKGNVGAIPCTPQMRARAAGAPYALGDK